MLDYLKNKIIVVVLLLGTCVAVIAFAGSPVFALESYAFVTKWGSSGSGDGEFNSPEGIDNYDTTLYVTDRNNNRVQKFTLNGVFNSKFGSSGSGDERVRGRE